MQWYFIWVWHLGEARVKWDTKRRKKGINSRWSVTKLAMEPQEMPLLAQALGQLMVTRGETQHVLEFVREGRIKDLSASPLLSLVSNWPQSSLKLTSVSFWTVESRWLGHLMKKPKSLWAQLAAGADAIVSQLAQRRPHLGRPHNWWCKESRCIGSG